MRPLAALAAVTLAAACSSNDPAGISPPDDVPRHVVATTPSGITIAAVRTGWVGVKEPHWRYSPPGFLVIPRLFLSRDWHEWIPNISYVVAVGGRVLLVDTGADPAIANPTYMDCDPNSRFFYEHNLRFVADADDTVDRQLPELGHSVRDIDTVVITHFHGDHPGRLGSFEGARVLTGPGNWPTHVGSVPCTLPLGFAPELATFGDGPFAEFPASQKLLDRDDVRLVPLPGHTRGHVGVMVEDAGRYWLIAGDATFNLHETEHTHVCGVSEDVESARETQRLILQQLHKHDTVLLPAHDPAVFALLAAPH